MPQSGGSFGGGTVGQVGGLPILSALPADFLFATASTALQNITGLAFPIGASATEIWEVELILEIEAANATMDAKFGFTVPAGASMRWGAVAGATTTAGYAMASTGNAFSAMVTAAQSIPFGTLAGVNGAYFKGKLLGGGTAGSVQAQGAQNTSDAGQLAAKAGSLVRATKLVA